MKQIDEKKNAEELLEIINEGTKKILDLAGIASHFGEDVANHMKDRLEEKKDEKKNSEYFTGSIHGSRFTDRMRRQQSGFGSIRRGRRKSN